MKPFQLHLLTKPHDDRAQTLISLEEEEGVGAIQVIDLAAGPPNYEDILTRVLEAESVHVW